MKKTMWKHIWHEIHTTLNRFIAIFAITALGAGVFAGLRATGTDMRNTANIYYQQQQLADIRLLSTFGFTEDDIAAINGLAAVAQIMPTYGLDVLTQADEGTDVMRIQALPGDTSADNAAYLNQIVLEEGRMPESAGEAVVDAETHYQIGDIITVSAENEQDTLDLLATQQFTVVGRANSPYYITFTRGNTNIGDGSLDGFLYVPENSFDSEYYLEVFLTLADTADSSAFSSEYETVANNAEVELEAFALTREEIRYAEVQQEYQEEIDDARQEYADKKEEVEQELADAWQELQDAAEEIADAKNQIANGEAEIAENQQKLADAQTEIDNAQSTINSSYATLADGELAYEEALGEYNSGKTAYDAGLAEYEQGLAQYESGLAEYNAQKAEYDAALQQIEALQAASDSLAASAQQLAQLVPAIGNAETEEEQAALAAFYEGATATTAGVRALAAQLAAGGQSDAALNADKAADSVESYLAAGMYAEAVGVLAAIPAAISPAIETAMASLQQAQPQLQQASQQLAESAAQLTQAKAQLDASLQTLQAGEVQIAQARAQLDSGWAQLQAGEAALAEARQELADGAAQLADAKTELANAKAELADGETEYQNGLAEYEDASQEAQQEFEDALQEIEDAQKELDELDYPAWYVYTRDDFPGYSGLSANAERINAIAGLLPYFFFLVAALVCLTTMTRMVEEQRTVIGTFKALGYGKPAIAAKFLLYAVAASASGSLFGVLIGRYVFPMVIWNAYLMMYTLPSISFANQLVLILQSVLAMVLVTTFATFASCASTLRTAPSELMRPKAPQKGTRVWLERIPFIWNRLAFSQKVTVRNLFRYKKRLFMTLAGVAGCTALLLTGFGLNDSIGGLVAAQYGTVSHYSLTLSLTDASSEYADTTLNHSLSGLGQVLYAQQQAVDVESGTANNNLLTTYLYIAETPANLEEFISFNDAQGNGQVVYPGDGEVVLTAKLANELSVTSGDTVMVNRANEKPVEVKVAGVVENYVLHYVYANSDTYYQITGQPPAYDMVLLKLADETADSNAVLEQLITNDNVTGGLAFDYLRDEFEDQMSALDAVIWLIIICAALLAFVVLYNLTNINITERQREIATLKVLGFFDKEVAGYVYRENVLLTILGTLLGLVLGVFLHRFVITTAEVDEVMFQRVVQPLSYVLAALFTMACGMVVNLVMLRKLQKIDMIESLKSAE